MKLKRAQYITGLLLWIVATVAIFIAEPCRGFYNPSTGRWLSRDPIGEKGGSNPYGFVNNSPIVKFDPDGRITVSTISFIYLSCGGALTVFQFYLDHLDDREGYVVQKVENSESVAFCGQKNIEKRETLWEATHVTSGGGTAIITDNATRLSRKRTKGAWSSVGEIKFFLIETTGNLDQDPNWGIGKASGSPNARSTETPPPWWNKPSDLNEQTGHRVASSSWNCCCNEMWSQYHIVPPPP